jgi:hypothetical protein
MAARDSKVRDLVREGAAGSKFHVTRNQRGCRAFTSRK